MRKKRSIFWTSAIILLLAVLAGCGQESSGGSKNSNSGEESGKQVLNLTEMAEIPAMDTAQATDGVSFVVMNNVFEGLYRLGPNNQPQPGIAKDFEVSEDGLHYTFNLREDAKWSNGEPVTAHDFVFAWKRALHPETLSPYAYIFGDIKNANAIMAEDGEFAGNVDALGVKAADDYSLEVELEHPAPYFVGLTAFGTFMPQNKAFVEEQGKNYALEADNLIYNGPFVLSEWNHDEGWQYEKNPEYWDADTVKLDEINVKVVKDIATGANLYDAGNIDRAILSADYVDQFKDSPEFETLSDSFVYFFRFNQETEAFTNKNIRKAIELAYDKEKLASVILNDGSIPANFLVPKNFTFTEEGKDFREKYPEFNTAGVEEAKGYWEKGLKELGTDNLTFEMLNYDQEDMKKVGEYIKNQLETNLPGLTVNIKQMPYKQKLNLEKTQQYEVALARWGPDYQDPMTFLDMFISDSVYNEMSYSNPQYDDLISKAKAETDSAKRWEMMQEAERMLLEEDTAISPIYQKGVAVLTKPYVKNIVKHTFGADYSFKWAAVEGK